MAFNTKIDLYDSKVIQCANQTLTLSGKTVIATSGDLRYQIHPTFTGATQVVDKCYVDTATGGISANNGLTRRGSFITLGGALTGDTTIGSSTCVLKINVNTLSLSGNTAFNLSTGNGVITDTGSNGGLKYAASYAASIVARSIPDAGWVTGKTSTSGIQTAGNGLTKTLTNVTLGGTISGTTVITDSRGAGLTLGVQYGGDYSGGYNARSLVDAGYVTGKTTTSGIQTANNGLNKTGTNVRLGGALTGNTTIGSGSCVLGVNVNKVNITGVTVNLGGCVTLKTAPVSYVGNILTYNASTGEVSQTTLSSLGGLTGATNGLTKNGQNVGLGGCLCCTTSIIGNEALCLGISGNRLGSLDLWSFDDTCMNARCLLMSSSGATYTDLTAVSKQGIKYAGDYSLTYGSRSLVDKGYVDSIATGLHVKAAVIAATTVPITLSTNQTIDGVLTTTGMRVLVKNQADATTNGIYSANTGSWGRTSDYNGTIGEVSNGDLIPITSGSTQNSSIWALVTPDPITVGVTSLNFTEFSTVVDIQGGQGICITQVGGTHTVCVNPISGCGLCVDPSGLCINNSIGGNGLTYSGGVINANACSCGAVAAINVGYNGSDNLVVACSDVTSMSAIVTGATNGLTKNCQNVGLGGSLCCNTTIDITCSYYFNICGVGTGVNFIDISDTTHCCGTDCHITLNSGCETNIWSNKSVNIGNCCTPNTPNINITYCCAAIVTDCTTSTPRGLQYAVDYSATFVDRSLIDKGYVHTFVTGGTTVLTANNGLHKFGTIVSLGGALTGATTINGAQNLRINVTTLDLSGNTSLNLTSPALTLQTTPPAGTTSDAVLVWNSVDKNIKIVSGAALGDKNNVYSHSAITTSVLLTTGSSYVILVNNSTPVTITLPATPLNGQVFKIKNVSGSAVTNIITVAGNTHNIDGSSSGLINTDYGALELMYDTTLTAWYSLAFIN
jgi:hypothetical protein